MANRIREFRVNLGMTQTELSRLTGLSKASISQAEKPWRTPKAPMLFKLAEGLGCKPYDLLVEEEQVQETG